MFWYLLDNARMSPMQGGRMMRRNVGRPTIPAHRRKTRIHLSITPSLIEEIDNDCTWNESRSQWITRAIKNKLNEEEPLMTFVEASAHDCLVKLVSTGLIDHDLFMSLQEKYRERPEFYQTHARTDRLKKEFEDNDRNSEGSFPLSGN